MGQRLGRLGQRLEYLARWWTSATEAQRYETLDRAIRGDSQAPTLEEIRFAAILAETEAGETREG